MEHMVRRSYCESTILLKMIQKTFSS